jgi:hypothetical protein
MDSLMIIVPNLHWRTFKYWAVSGTDVRAIVSSPLGYTESGTAPQTFNVGADPSFNPNLSKVPYKE